MTGIGLHAALPSLPPAELAQIGRELVRNAASGEGVVITMPDGFSFDLVIDEVMPT